MTQTLSRSPFLMPTRNLFQFRPWNSPLSRVRHPASIAFDGNRVWRKEAPSLWLDTVVKVDSTNANVKVSF